MKRFLLYLSIAYIILVIFLYLANIIFHVLGTPDDWKDFATYFAGMIAPVTAIATIYITYLVYKLNDDSHRAERYFEKIANLYWEIQETHNTLCVEKEDANTIEAYEYKIKMQVQILRYYLKRFPDLSHSIKSFDLVLNDIWFEPMNKKYYEALKYEFENFCYYANQNQERPMRIVKNNEGGPVDVDY